jgi:hypothetical protein
LVAADLFDNTTTCAYSHTVHRLVSVNSLLTRSKDLKENLPQDESACHFQEMLDPYNLQLHLNNEINRRRKMFFEK